MKQKNLLETGLDTIAIDIKTEYELVENNFEFYSTKTGNRIGTMVHKQGKEHGYRLNINLPKCVNQTNLHPVTPLDVFHLHEITKMITNNMMELFGENYPSLMISTCEVNSTITLQNTNNVEPMLNMIAHMLLTKMGKVYVCMHGTKKGKRYQKVSSLQSGFQIESIRTEQLSNGRMCFKMYNKSLEQNIDDKGIIRIESVYNRAGLNFAKTGETLQEFLTVESINRLLAVYRSDYKKYFIDVFWNNSGHPFYKDCIDVIYNDLKQFNGHPTTVALINRNIIEWDFSLFEKACRKYYSKRNSADHAIRRVKRSKEIEIHEGVIDDFVEISKGIIKG